MEDNPNDSIILIKEPTMNESNQLPNIVLKMSQIKTKLDSLLIYFGALFLGLLVSTVLTSMLQIEWKITSSFEAFDIGPIITIIKGLLSTLLIPLLSKLSDIYGRAPIYIISTLIWIIGNFYMGFSNSFRDYSIGSIISGFGETGNTLLLPIILADFLNPKDRGFGFILYTFPDLIALGVSLPVIGVSEQGENWRWLVKSFGILLIIFALPIIVTLFKLQFRAKRLLPNFSYKLSSLQKVDWIGIIFLTLSLSCILIPFSLVIKYENGWQSKSIYIPIIFGLLSLIGFFIWELKFSKYSIINYSILNNRAAIIMVIIRALLFFDSNLTWTYMSPYLSLTRDLDQFMVSQIYLGFRISWYVSGFLTAFALRRFTNYSRIIVQTFICVNAIGTGLALGSRYPNSPTWFVILAEAIIGIGSGVSACAGLVILQSAVQFSEIANISAIDALLSNIFGTIAIALTNTIWNFSTYNNLIKQLPTNYHELIPKLISNNEYNELIPIEFKKNWIKALGDSQWLMCTISTILSCICFLISYFLPPINLENCQLIMNSLNISENQEVEEIELEEKKIF